MPQDAGAGDMNPSKRLPNPAYVYGPMVYQFPNEQGGETENVSSKGSKNINFLAPVLIIVLAVGSAILYVKGNGAEIGQFNLNPSISDPQFFGGDSYNRLQQRVLSRARVAADRLYLREGPGTEFVASYILFENWGVSLMGEYRPDERGEVWARILVETGQGPQEGWVSRKFLRF